MTSKKPLHIALITYEFPEEIFIGGIGSYMKMLAYLLASNKHQVEVFCATKGHSGTKEIMGVSVHSVESEDLNSFRTSLLSPFKIRHELFPFDIIEAPESLSPSSKIREVYPTIPHVIKLHGSHYVLNSYKSQLSRWQKFRFLFGAWRRGKELTKYWTYDYNQDPEYDLVAQCPYIYTPSEFMTRAAKKAWPLQNHIIETIPNPFKPAHELLEIDIKRKQTDKINILLLSRLDELKGCLELVNIIPSICEKFPNVHWHLVGSSHSSGNYKNFRDYIQGVLSNYDKQVSYRDKVTYEEVSGVLANSDICVFPSRFESFGYGCLEAMAAGRAIVASENGGMKYLLQKNAGLAVNTFDSYAFEASLSKLIQSPSLRYKMGINARERSNNMFYTTDLSDEITRFYKHVINQWDEQD